MIDMAGLAQKGGAVFTPCPHRRRPRGHPRHPRLGRQGRPHPRLRPRRVRRQEGAGGGRDEATRSSSPTPPRSMPGEFARSADFSLPTERLKKAIRGAAGDGTRISSTPRRTATALFGNSLGANMFMLGFACQHGGLPLSAEAIEKAIELNGEAVAMNIAAFRWGRRAAHEPDFVRGCRPAPGRAGHRPPAADAGRDHRPPRRLPHRLPERRLCQAAIADRIAARPRGRGQGRCRARPRSPRRSPATCSS